MSRRILLSMIAVTAVAVTLFAIPLAVAVGRLYRSREVATLQTEATRVAGAIPSGGLDGTDPIELPAVGSGHQLALYDSRGLRVAGDGPEAASSTVRAALDGRVIDSRAGSWLTVSIPVHDEEQVVGAIRAAAPWDVVVDRTRTAWLAMLGLGLGALGVATIFARSQSRRLTAPIDNLAIAATRLGDGDFGISPRPVGVAELDRVAAALDRTAARLGDLVARERAFTADASHQLRTPLTSLRLTLETALLAPIASSTHGGVHVADREPEMRGAITEAITEVERLERTVATLLALARDTPQAHTVCDIATVCAEAVVRHRGDLARTGRALRADIEPSPFVARCSPDALREILDVLLDNAVRHGRGQVTLRARHAGKGAIVEVEDEGSGIAGDPESVFARRNPGSAGTGIGLALARTLADSQGARLQLRRARPHPLFSLAVPGP